MRTFFTECVLFFYKNVDFNNITEVRLRVGNPISVVGNKECYLAEHGLTYNKKEGIICHSRLIDEILQIVSNSSLYAINDQLIQGYITVDGIRIGVAGELVVVNGNIKTIKNIPSIIDKKLENALETSSNIFPFFTASARTIERISFAHSAALPCLFTVM